MNNISPYISRQSAEHLQNYFARALADPASYPVMFYIWGIGGVGKTTLKRRLEETYRQQADFTEISLGLTEGINTPIDLMAKLHAQLPRLTFWQRNVLAAEDPFQALYVKYQQIANQLQTQPIDGKESVEEEQVVLVKSLLKSGASTLGELMSKSELSKPLIETTATKTFDITGMLLTERDLWQVLLHRHQATKKSKELQDLMLEPILKLTKAFAEALVQRSQQTKKTVVLVLDNYEKVPSDLDRWLWQSLLANTQLQPHRVRLVVAGRKSLLDEEVWRRLQRDRNLIFECQLDRFDQSQTQKYLQDIGINDKVKITTLLKLTKGLPYYLNWVRQQHEKGKPISFAQVDQEIVKLSVQGLNKPITNPYTIGDPVLGERFIGREDIIRQLEELWFINISPQSVILYGHRRMGKTSILRNSTTKVNSQVRVAYVNLLSIGSAPNGITDLLMAICDAIQEVTEISAPNNSDLFQFPETTFRRHLQNIEKNFTGKGLIIALDEFEKIEELIESGKLGKEFLGFLRGMVQMSSKLAFAFAGLHTLQEMNADYFQPFYASFIPISVAFLTREATHQVLANPDPEFLLEYEPTALDHIYDLTNGQPYLTQLIGFQLVRMFNDYVFEQGKPRDRTFTIDDVRTVCSGENFFNTGINYFNGVWQQAAEGATHQHELLKSLAPHSQGLTESELISQTNLPSESLHSALKTLKDHDVIRSQKTNEIVNWAIAVELFRTWVVKYKLNSIDS